MCLIPSIAQQMWFIWPFTMRNHDASSLSEQTGGPRHNRKRSCMTTQGIQLAEMTTELKVLAPRETIKRSSLAQPTPNLPITSDSLPSFAVIAEY